MQLSEKVVEIEVLRSEMGIPAPGSDPSCAGGIPKPPRFGGTAEQPYSMVLLPVTLRLLPPFSGLTPPLSLVLPGTLRGIARLGGWSPALRRALYPPLFAEMILCLTRTDSSVDLPCLFSENGAFFILNNWQTHLSVACVAWPLGITVHSVLTEISPVPVLEARGSESLSSLESGRPCRQWRLCPRPLPSCRAALFVGHFLLFFLFMFPLHQSPSLDGIFL
jgi:hypothetical protein